MEAHLPYPHLTLSLPKSNENFLAKCFDEIPTFEEAFDPISLRKFFQEHESTNSQSSYSPHKELSFLDDIHSQTTDDREAHLSPSSQYLTKNTPNEMMNSRPYLTYNFNLNSNLIKQCFQSFKGQSTFKHPPFIIQKIPHKPANHSLASIKTSRGRSKLSSKKKITKKPHEDNDDIGKFICSDEDSLLLRHSYQMMPKQLETPFRKEESGFDKLVRAKKVFRIEKETKFVSKSMNMKRRASLPLEEGPLPALKKNKSQTGNGQNLSENKVFFSFNLPIKQNPPVYRNISNYFNQFEDEQVYNASNPYAPSLYGNIVSQHLNFRQNSQKTLNFQ